MSKSALFFDLHSGQQSVMSTLMLLVVDRQTPFGLLALQVNFQHVLWPHGRQFLKARSYFIPRVEPVNGSDSKS